MSSPDPKPQLIIIVGPTAVGKTEVSISLAERLDGEIVSADSRLFYRGMDIGTAKPSFESRARVRHHLIDIAEPSETWSLAKFQEAVYSTVADIIERKRLPFLVGGSGQYVRSITDGWTPPSLIPNEQLRHVLTMIAETLGKEKIHGMLRLLDPEAAEIIDPRNLRRTIRALEVIFLTGRRFSHQRKRNQTQFSPLIIGLTRPRAELYARIDARIEQMFSAGFLNEVRSLLAKGYSPSLPSMSAIGYGECVRVLQGEITRDDAIVQIKRKTRIYVRRQANWFKMNDPDIHWFDLGKESESILYHFIQSNIKTSLIAQ